MLSPNEREWLTRERELMLSAADKADLYADALTSMQWSRWWSLWRPSARQQRRTRKRVAWLLRMAQEQVQRRQAVILAWTSVYAVVAGPGRGPYVPGAVQAAPPLEGRNHR